MHFYSVRGSGGVVARALRAARALLIGCLVIVTPGVVIAREEQKTPTSELVRSSTTALDQLYASVPAAATLRRKAHAVLVFPKVTKAGLGIGGQYGEGTLMKGGKPAGHFSTVGASYGLQAGVQTFGYAMFFMSAAALRQFEQTEGFEIGVGPSVVMVDEGMAKTMTTNTLTSDIYVFVFGQKGLMYGLGVQGNKITPIAPK
jgi:lipid-binding SYLF domain-containing protein